MKIIFNKDEYNSYKDFYIDVLKKLNSKRFPDWEDEKNLGFNGNLLNEFLWYCSEDSNDYIFVNFNKQKNENNYESKQWDIIFFYFKELVRKHPNNTLTFLN